MSIALVTGGNAGIGFASFKSVREAASIFLATERPVNVCVLNAGIMALPWHKTGDGFEQQWQVNALGHFLFCRLLLPALIPVDEGALASIYLATSKEVQGQRAMWTVASKDVGLGDDL